MKDKREGFPGCAGCKYENDGQCVARFRLGVDYYNGCLEWYAWFVRQWRDIRRAAGKLPRPRKEQKP